MAKIRQLALGVVLAASFLCLTTTPLFGKTFVTEKGGREVTMTSGTLVSKVKETDSRTVKLRSFLEKFDSPLTPYTNVFIEAADAYKIDWRLVPAITGVESTFGKHIPHNSFNAYGWNNGDFRFASWEVSIWHVSRVLREKYLDRGLVSVQQIARVYAPPANSWGGKVAYFMKQIESTPVYKLDL